MVDLWLTCDHFVGEVSAVHGDHWSSWKVMENNGNVVHFLNYGILKLHGKII